MWSDVLIIIVAVIAGAIAAVTGFGIGSLLTPVLALQVDTRLAVAAVSIPHVVGTALRLWLLQGRVDRRVLWGFRLTSAAGGLAGAALHGWASNRWLTMVFGLLLLFAAVSEVSGLAQRMRFHGSVAWIAGAVSGLLGGLVGNQGGIRSAALLGFGLSKQHLSVQQPRSGGSSMERECQCISRCSMTRSWTSGRGWRWPRLVSHWVRSWAVVYWSEFLTSGFVACSPWFSLFWAKRC